MPETPFVSLIIPAWNEEASRGKVIEVLPAGLFSQVLVADNGSTDGTAAVAAAHGATVVAEPRRGYYAPASGSRQEWRVPLIPLFPLTCPSPLPRMNAQRGL